MKLRIKDWGLNKMNKNVPLEVCNARTLKTWKAFFIVMEAYLNKDLHKRYKLQYQLCIVDNTFRAEIKSYFAFCKKEKAIPPMSLATLKSVWYLISELKGLRPIGGNCFISAVFGSPIFGSGNGEGKRFNAVVVDTKQKLNYSHIKIFGFLAPQDFGAVGGFVTVQDVKNMIDKGNRNGKCN